MANPEQLDLLKESVEGWNKWRKENPNIVIDLRKAELSNTNLVSANLEKANMLDANLCEADLRKVNLDSANLLRSKLIKANLSGASLINAELSETDLNKANLCNANLTDVNIENANLSETNLSRSDFFRALLDKVNLDQANLSDASFLSAHLYKCSLIKANLYEAQFSGANLYEANLCEASCIGTEFDNADLTRANLAKADLRVAFLKNANLNEADLRGANLSPADLSYSNLVQTKIDGAKISGSKIYGISVWDLVGEFKEQKELIITPEGESRITVDNIKVAQFVYLILNNKEIRDVINTLTSKTVLILGRFSIPERKAILDALRNKLREYNLLPIVFDFDRPTDKDFTETIKTLAGISYFVIADVTNPKSSPLELQATIPDYQIPFVPIIQEGEYPFAMMVDLQKNITGFWILSLMTH